MLLVKKNWKQQLSRTNKISLPCARRCTPFCSVDLTDWLFCLDVCIPLLPRLLVISRTFFTYFLSPPKQISPQMITCCFRSSCSHSGVSYLRSRWTYITNDCLVSPSPTLCLLWIPTFPFVNKCSYYSQITWPYGLSRIKRLLGPVWLSLTIKKLLKFYLVWWIYIQKTMNVTVCLYECFYYIVTFFLLKLLTILFAHDKQYLYNQC